MRSVSFCFVLLSLSAERKALDGEEEDVSCTPLLFKDDILSDQYFGEQQHTSIVTEKAHFGEGMHRKAFRTMVRSGLTPLFGPGHPCVLKVHSSIGYTTQNNDEVVRRNHDLAVEVREKHHRQTKTLQKLWTKFFYLHSTGVLCAEHGQGIH